jgi:hypothetical protein
MTPKPSSADFGLNVTIGIIAAAIPDDIFVCVADQRISFGDETQADDAATMKALGIHPDWLALFAGNEIKFVLPILLDVKDQLSGNNYDSSEIQNAFSAAYTRLIQQEFKNKKLSKFGYTSVDQFRTEGRANLDDYFFELCRELDAYDVGVQFLVCGYDKQKQGKLFEISSPGAVTDHNLLGYGVIGSGYSMATASLRRKPLKYLLDSTIYRVLEAKFSAETASAVGKPTTVILKSRRESVFLPQDDIKGIRSAWKKTVEAPDPKGAISLVNKSAAVRQIMDWRRS